MARPRAIAVISASEGGYRHALGDSIAGGTFEPGKRQASVRIEANLLDRLADRETGRPVALEAQDLAGGEDLADREDTPFGLRHEEPPVIDVEDVPPRGREEIALALEEVAPGAARAAAEARLREGRRVPEDFRPGQLRHLGRRGEPGRLVGRAVVVADAAIAVARTLRDDARARQGRPVEAAGRSVAAWARTVGRSLSGHRAGGQEYQSAQQKPWERPHAAASNYALSARISVMRVKN